MPASQNHVRKKVDKQVEVMRHSATTAFVPVIVTELSSSEPFCSTAASPGRPFRMTFLEAEAGCLKVWLPHVP